MTSQRDHALGLLARARDDLYVVRRLSDDAGAPVRVLGFHAQQAAEKAIKAVLSAAGLAYPRTHNLDMLAGLLSVNGRDVPPAGSDLDLLTPFAVILRYDESLPDDEPLPAPGQLVEIAEQMVSWAETLVEGEA